MNANGLTPYGSQLSAGVEYYDGANPFFRTSARGTLAEERTTESGGPMRFQ